MASTILWSELPDASRMASTLRSACRACSCMVAPPVTRLSPPGPPPRLTAIRLVTCRLCRRNRRWTKWQSAQKPPACRWCHLKNWFLEVLLVRYSMRGQPVLWKMFGSLRQGRTTWWPKRLLVSQPERVWAAEKA